MEIVAWVALGISALSILISIGTGFVYYKQWQIMAFSLKINEMHKLVGPLYNEIENPLFFVKGSRGYKIHQETDATSKTFYEFWKNIKENLYLTTPELQKSLKKYFGNTVNQLEPVQQDDQYKLARKELYDRITERYIELNEELIKEKGKSSKFLGL
jgi:hypothetical protein